ncbi:gp37 long tail fiber, distal subunit [Escherichia phage PP01]|uniref:Long tail fiber protein Gp37 n=1 Tax=Escherichia phage PP01 TaxID=2060720 RepID=A0A2Z5WLD4_9CAUD|nr:long tail fiber protein distal subunit [Escherichia phage PP01]BBC14588.1 gp37 long tail fiber, distal subunit [Escherichia phage PP01]
MATLKQIQFKRSKTAGARPAASVLAEGELAINLKDRVLFTKDDQGNIIDLGFAKGGSIDGNVIHTGNYNQTGDYTLNGVFTQTGNFNLTGIARVTRDIIAAGQIMTEGGELITKSSGTAHVRFFDNNSRERGIIYAPANDGLTTQVLNIRVQDYAAGNESTYAFSGSGLFTSPEVSAWKSISSPQILTDKVITNGKKTGDYDIYSLSNNTPMAEGETAINHLRVMRNAVGAGIFHEVNVNDGITWYSGDGLDTYLWSFNWAGGLKAGHSISVGLPGGSKGYSELGTASIALGDNDTGFKWHQDGYFHTVNNGTRTFIYGPAETQSLRKMVMGYSPDGILMTTPPTENYALATVVTYHDNNAFGDGQTLLGYYQGGNYHHYFRGKGTTNINTHGGLLVTPGDINVIGGSVNIDGRNNSSTLLFRGNTTGTSSVDNMTISVWGNTFTNPSEGTRKNVMEISDATSWMSYIQRTTAGKVESVINGTQIVNENLTVVKNATFDGTISAAGEIATNAVNALRIWNADYGAIFRRSEESLHIIPTAYGEGKDGDIGPLRPFSMALDTGKVTIPDLQSKYNTITANGYIKFVGHGAGAGGYDIQYVQAAPIFQEIDDDAVSKYYPIVKQKFLNGKCVWSLGTEINSGTFVIHHLKEDGSQGHTSRFNQDGTVNFPDNVAVGGGEATIARNGNIWSDIWKTFTSAGDITNIRDAIATRVAKEGDTMTGKLTLSAGNDALVLTAGAGASSHIRSDVGGTGNWYIGKGGGDNGLGFYSYITQGAVYITNNGEISLSPQGQGTFNFNRDRLHINGTQWIAHQAGDWGNQWRQEAPIFVDFGSVGNDCYYPIIKGKSGITNEGYFSGVDFGMRRIPNNWAQGIIRVGNQENGSDPQAIFEFHHNGNMYVPDMVKAGVRVSAGGGDPVWTGACVVIGDNDTGLVHGGDGRINMVANGMHIASWSSAYHLHEGLWDTTGALWTEQGRAIISFGHLIQQSDSYSTYVRDVYVRSDIRVKKDLVKFENASEKLSKINGYTYMQKRGLDEEGNQKWEPNAGLIAQEVQAILPELVEGDPDGEALLRLNYNGVIGLNTAAINEHTAEIAELKSEIEELKALVKSLLK